MQQSIRDRLLVCLKALVNNNTLLSTTLKIKLTGDGTFIGKHIHVVHLPYLMTAIVQCQLMEITKLPF